MRLISVNAFVLLLISLTITLVVMACTDDSTAADNWPTPGNVHSWVANR
ncbi:hypothetical protein [Pseudonocardia sp. NPDC049154]